ncbi:serine/threonine protein kinase [Peptoclostridium litorale DSM 5388]|uniref:Serine/threonine-protein kinase n=1 Tax=Peptoclostridium litorale DSM 5388 TaxID=1121324 RepID=A0A069RDR6_PEPLI|nr:protein kinase [Peptoclostridium litorale]KDR94350.1 serine/threonine-protein kinase [Peptoclostridium litorale DSM 5388]SIO37934.1 serine/threonine protein kinase [Peptoclostridium litorale DSM 5388]
MSGSKEELAKYIEKYKLIRSYLGDIHVDKSDRIGAGGNGVVYSGKLNDSNIAIKFFVENGLTKLTRFKSEFFNVQMLPANKNIVNLINYEELTIVSDESEKEIMIPYILMKKYDESLKQYRNARGFDEVTFLKLFNFLIEGIKFIHLEGIIHRDIKPENILVTHDDEFVLTDFGIAHYNPERFALKANTKRGDRLGNYEFSAPEQAEKGIEPAQTMDIYAFGQLLQWYCHGSTHRGTGRESIAHLIAGVKGEIIDSIINKCLYNEPSNRFESIEEIEKYLESELARRKKPDAFEEMRKFSTALRKSVLSNYRKPYYINEPSKIENLIAYLNKQNFKRKLEFNTGCGNNTIDSIRYIDTKKILIDHREFELNGIWIYCNDSLYDDIVLLDCVKYDFKDSSRIQPDAIAYLSSHKFDEVIEVPISSLESGFVEIENNIYDINELKVQERYPNYSYNFVAIGTMYHSTILHKNDGFLESIQTSELNPESIKILIKNISRNKHDEVFLRI